MSQGQIVTELQKAKAKDYDSGITGRKLKEMTKMQTSTFYRCIGRCLKGKRIRAEGKPRKYFLP